MSRYPDPEIIVYNDPGKRKKVQVMMT